MVRHRCSSSMMDDVFIVDLLGRMSSSSIIDTSNTSVLSECMQYSGNEDLSDLDKILLSLRSSSFHVGDLLDEILVTRQRQAHDGVVAKLQQLRLCLSEL